MESKKIIWLGATIGSIIGSYIPGLWGVSSFSMTSILLGGVGALLGIYVTWKITQ